MTSYIYTLENSTKACCDLTAEEFAALEVGDFESAMDLPDGVEFARGFDAEGNQIKVYRQEV